MKLKNILVIGLTSMTLVSCNDFLKVESPSSYSEEFVFSQKTEINPCPQWSICFYPRRRSLWKGFSENLYPQQRCGYDYKQYQRSHP